MAPPRSKAKFKGKLKVNLRQINNITNFRVHLSLSVGKNEVRKHDEFTNKNGKTSSITFKQKG